MSLEIKGLSVSLQKKNILYDINLKFEDREFVSVLGESGCGKSTLLKSISGLVEISAGDIVLDKKSIKDISPSKRDVLMVFQDLRLFPHMNVAQNIAFPLHIRKMDVELQRQRVKQLLKAVKLEGYEQRKISEISGGQMQRVALARALAAEPKILLLDEPFSGLDEGLKLEMEELVKDIHRSSDIITVLVTHDRQQALRISDKIVFMDAGSIIQFDTPHLIYNKPYNKLVADYFSKPAYIEGEVKNAVFRSARAEFNCNLEDGYYTAMIRESIVSPDIDKDDYVIKDIKFAGAYKEFVIEFDETMLRVVVSEGDKAFRLDKGAKVGLSFNEESIVYFKS